MKPSNPNYRPDIDGLRAVSVLAILFFHGGFEWAGGGFVGVDVFFVISGFLITGIIVKDLDAGTFSFANFYRRRIKRLFPALVFTLLLVLVAGYLLFSPTDLQRLGQSTQYAVVSLSNFFFWQEAGYFNDASEFKPLLHTWSLAIEEQYYLLWPALLFAIAKVNKKGTLTVVLLVAMAVSLWLNQRYIGDFPSTAFFLLPFRVFEFALGGLCLVLYQHLKINRIGSELAVLAGLAMIIWSVVSYDADTHFPGWAALVPCVGAALVIVAGQSMAAQWLLSNRLMVTMGLISYSVYLIHWPLLVFYKYWHFSPITLTATVVLLGLSLLVGYMMWRWVEQPFRPVKPGSSQSRFWMTFVLVVAGVWALGMLTQKNQGWPHRYPDEYFMTAQEIDDNRKRYWEFFSEEVNQKEPNPDHRQVIVMGNSHAVDLVYAMMENDAQLDVTYFNSWHRCYHFGSPMTPKDEKSCGNKLRRHLKNPAWKTADAVYLHDHWPQLDLPDLKKRLAEIRAITQAPIVVFGPKMTYKKRVPDIILSHLRMASMNAFAQQFSDRYFLKNLNAKVKDMLADIEVPDVSYVDVLAVQCGPETDQCEIVSKDNQAFLYFDYSHFTLQGAREFGAKLKAAHPELF